MTAPHSEDDSDNGHRFHGWRLLGAIMVVVFLLAGVSALVDWVVLGRIEAGA